jgi:hypothetical protein
MNPYVYEKLRELETEQLKNRLYFEPESPRRRALFGAVAAIAGRTLRRAGEGLESWATPPAHEHEHRMARRAAR